MKEEHKTGKERDGRKSSNSFNKRTHLIGEGASCMVYRGNVYGYPTAIKVFNEDKGAW